MKKNLKFSFGEKIKTRWRLERQVNAEGIRQWIPWKRRKKSGLVVMGPNEFAEAIFLGYRTLKDGKMEWTQRLYSDQYDPFFHVSEYHAAALICIKGYKPEYVFIEHVEKLEGTKNEPNLS